ncbi:MAG: patatin-like phospholipase family protein [Chlorobi bacterium]|nr:patatin-like phospholipase family protein [Chlorobiota bacterium]
MKHLFWRALFLWSLLLSAQSGEEPAGLVLSGGGAKGYAHIGVLQALEEAGLTPRYLTGTSIGAIVGAYYAAGYTPEEIKRKFREMNMADMMQDKLPRRYLPLYEKKTGRDNFFYFPVDKKTLAVHLPQGLTNYQLFYNRLFKDLFHIQYVSSFDSLPVAVRFYATDLVNGCTVAFDSGSIPRAVAASSAFPSIVAPLKIDGMLLTDGGILNNYPIDELYALGARFTVGVDVQGRLKKEHEIRGMPDILDQITAFYMYANMPRKRAMTHIYIRPAVTEYAVTAFEGLDTLVRLGYEAARPYIPRLREAAARTPKINRPVPRRPDSLWFKDIRITSPSGPPPNRAQILWKANFAPRKKIAFEDFETGINYLYGTGDYKQIHYWIEPDSTLVMDVVRDTVNIKLKLAYHYSPLYKINLLAGFVYRNFLRENGTLDMEFILGDPLRYNFNLLFDNGYHFGYGFSSSFHQFERNVSYPLFFEEVTDPSFNRMDLHFARWQNQLYFITLLSTNFNLRAGPGHTYYNMYTTVFSSADNNKKFFLAKSHYLTAFFDLYYDDMDDFYFPFHGVVINFRAARHHPLAENDEGFYQLDFYLSGARRHGSRWSTSYELRAGLLTHSDPPLPFLYYPGGIAHHNPVENLVPFYSRDYLALKTPGFMLFQPQIQTRIRKNHYLQWGAQGMVAEQKTPARLTDFALYYNIYMRYGLKSFFGPVFVTYAWEPSTGKGNLNFSVGFFF